MKTDENILLHAIAKIFPQAPLYTAQTLACEGVFESADALAARAEQLKRDLNITDEPLDDLLINVILLRQSAPAAKKQVEIYKSTGQKPVLALTAAALAQVKDGDLLKKLNAVNDNPKQNAVFASKAMLNIITEEEALLCAALAKALKYPLLEDDLQTLALKYGPVNTPAETAEIFEAVLRGLPYLDEPVENLGLAVSVITDGRAQTLQNAQATALRRREKILFMRKLCADKFFAPYADELTNKFFGGNSIDEISSMFHHILKELPHINDIYENADIAVKVLLKKLPLQDAVNQAVYQKENKTAAAPAAAALEQEAFQSYLGVKNKEEVLSFFKTRLVPFNFWRHDDAKHCYALSALVGELNGKINAQTADLTLAMLEAGCPEESVETVTAGLAGVAGLSNADILAAYQKFYAAGNEHQDAARRAVNMMQ